MTLPTLVLTVLAVFLLEHRETNTQTDRRDCKHYRRRRLPLGIAKTPQRLVVDWAVFARSHTIH